MCFHSEGLVGGKEGSKVVQTRRLFLGRKFASYFCAQTAAEMASADPIARLGILIYAEEPFASTGLRWNHVEGDLHLVHAKLRHC